MLTLTGVPLAFALLIAFLVGSVIGYIFASTQSRLEYGGQSPAEMKESFDAYKGKVDEHFATTNDLLKGLTSQYREVYAHMAAGAQELCSVEPAKLEDHLRLEDMSAAIAIEEAAVADAAEEDAEDNVVAADDAEAGDEAGADQSVGESSDDRYAPSDTADVAPEDEEDVDREGDGTVVEDDDTRLASEASAESAEEATVPEEEVGDGEDEDADKRTAGTTS